jgi:hypothetical protein
VSGFCLTIEYTVQTHQPETRRPSHCATLPLQRSLPTSRCILSVTRKLGTMNECLSVAKLTSDGVTALSQHVTTEPLSSSAFLTAQPGTCSNALGLPSEAISTMMTDRIGYVIIQLC